MDFKRTLLLLSLSIVECPCNVINVNITEGPNASEIIGGNPAKIKDFPFLVSLHHYVTLFQNGHSCCGFLLTPSWIGTAAHCLIDHKGSREILPTWYFYVLASTTDLVDRDNRYQKRYPDAFIPHPRFSWSSLYNDIGLIRVSRPFDYNGQISLATVPSNQHYELDHSMTCTVAGWGVTDKGYTLLYRINNSNTVNILSYTGSISSSINDYIHHHQMYSTVQDNYSKSSDKLMSATLNLIPQKACERDIGGSFFLNPAGSLCTYSNEGKKDACKGDSGSALLCRLPNTSGRLLVPEMANDWMRQGWGVDSNQQMVVGIVSWSWECARTGVPAVHTDIRDYREWMRSTVVECNKSTRSHLLGLIAFTSVVIQMAITKFLTAGST